jgi:ABC-type sugar transport system ATPase subunit
MIEDCIMKIMELEEEINSLSGSNQRKKCVDSRLKFY